MNYSSVGEGCARAALRGCGLARKESTAACVRFAMVLLVSATLHAQLTIAVAPLDKSIPPGVTVVTSSDPSFASLVDGLVPASFRPILRPILPYSIVVQNNSTLPILAVAFYADMVDAQGHVSSVGQGPVMRGGIPPLKGAHPLLPQGGSVFLPADQVYSIAVQRAQEDLPMLRDFYAKTQKLPAVYESARSVTFVLDLLLFADGKFVGPDKGHVFEEWSNQIAAGSALDKAVLSLRGRSVDELKEYLAMASTPPEKTPANSRYARQLRRFAKVYEDYLQRKGPDALFDMAQNYEERVAFLALHR
jgi:hypothetical protein